MAAGSLLWLEKEINKNMPIQREHVFNSMNRTYEHYANNTNNPEQLKTIIKNMQKKLYSVRPSLDYLQSMSGGGDGVKMPYYPLPMQTLYEIALYSDVIRNIKTALKTEIFRNGFEIEERFKMKCVNCNKEFQEIIDTCDTCGGAVIRPDKSQRDKLDKFIGNENEVNLNHETIFDILKQMEDDLDTVDDAYMILIKEYGFINGEIVNSNVKEMLRGNPLFIRMITDQTGRPGYTDDGERVMVCPEHRSNMYTSEDICPVCGKKLYPAYFKALPIGGQKSEGEIFYIEDEIVHVSKFSPSLTYGFPPILTIWQKALTLLNMDKYMKDYYSKQRPPKGLLMVNTRNADGLARSWDDLLEEVRKNPHDIRPLAVESNSTRGQVAQFVDLMKPLEEMQYTETREEMRRTIGAVYGVMPIFQGDMRDAGGLNNEGLQITVTNRAAEESQTVFNNKVLTFVIKNMGITDWRLILKSVEQVNDRTKLEIEAMKIENAQRMQNLGFEVDIPSSSDLEVLNDFKVEKRKEDPYGLRQSGFGQESFGQTPIGNTPYKDSTETPNLPEAVETGKSLLKKKDEMNKIFEPKTPDNEDEEIEESLKAKKTGLKETKSKENTFRTKIEEDLYEHVKDLNFKIKLSKNAMKAKINALVKRVTKDIQGTTKSEIRKIYTDTMKLLGKDLKLRFAFNQRDEEAVKALQTSDVLNDSFLKMEDNVKEKLIGVMNTAYAQPGKFSINDMVEEMKEVYTDTDAHLRTIARTETTKISNTARINSYQKIKGHEKIMFKVLNPRDHRTTSLCKTLVDKTRNGVTMDKLLDMAEKESKKFNPKFMFNKEFPVFHVNCRSSIVRWFP